MQDAPRVTTRLSFLKHALRSWGCTHALVSDPVDVEYLSGFRATNAYALISRTDALLLTDFRYKEAAVDFCRDSGEWKFVETKEKIFASLSAHLPPRARLGVQSDNLTVDQFDAISKGIPGIRLVKSGKRISQAFVAKLPTEVAAMHKAARIGDHAFERFRAGLRAGMTESDAAAMLEGFCRELGSERPSFDTIVLFGARTALPHGQPSNARLRRGDWVLVDFGCTVKGLCSDMTRTIVAGRASDRQRAVYEIVRRAREAARNGVRADARASEIDALARAPIAQAGYGDNFGHATGHGVGRRIHEAPRVAQKNRERLPAGCVITIEPGIYIPDFGGVRIEDMVVAQPGGSRLLTHTPRRLMEVDV